jgi:GDP-L-fucose synthase
MNLSSKILVAGSAGMVGSAIVKNLKEKGYNNILEVTRSVVDLTNQSEVKNYFEVNRPEYVFLSAAKVGGIMANNNGKADFIYDNLMIQSNIIHYSYVYGVKKLLFLGSSCIYPKFAKQPITEEELLTGVLEPTNDSYAIAKIAGIKMCQSYREQYKFDAIALMPTNLYGENDNFDINTGHVLPAMIAKFDAAKRNSSAMTLWGDGSPKREFLHVDDLAEECYVCMKKYSSDNIINIGSGEEVTIKELSGLIAKSVNYENKIEWDISKPNGTPRKFLNSDKIRALGWVPKISLEDGIMKTYEWYIQNKT